MNNKNIPDPSISFPLTHIKRMTDNIGILEHCIFSTPDRNEGYAIDDNARALQVFLRLNNSFPEDEFTQYISIYLQFLLSARSPQGFHQDLHTNLTWKDDAEVNEGYGRAMAALGEAAILASRADQKLAAVFMFDRQALLINDIVQNNRLMVQIITGLFHRIKFETSTPELTSSLVMRKKLKGDMPIQIPINLQPSLIRLADGLVASYKANCSPTWHWYEDRLVYDNGRLPMGLLYAYQNCGNKIYLEIALESLNFLLAQTYNHEKTCFSFPGYRDWFMKDGKRALFGQQPIEAGSTVEVCSLAYEITHQKKYLDFALKALAWYNGRNILEINMVNSVTGGIKDGLESWGVNPNEGAESILSYALACLALKKILL